MEAGAGAPLLHGATLPAGMTGPQACPHSKPMCLIPGLCLLTSNPLLIHDVDSIWHCMERSRAQSPMTGMQQQQVWCKCMHVSRTCPRNTCQNKPDRSHCPHLGTHCGPDAPTVHASLEREMGPRGWRSHESRTKKHAISRVLTKGVEVGDFACTAGARNHG